jgi:hypothetical protein
VFHVFQVSYFIELIARSYNLHESDIVNLVTEFLWSDKETGIIVLVTGL